MSENHDPVVTEAPTQEAGATETCPVAHGLVHPTEGAGTGTGGRTSST